MTERSYLIGQLEKLIDRKMEHKKICQDNGYGWTHEMEDELELLCAIRNHLRCLEVINLSKKLTFTTY